MPYVGRELDSGNYLKLDDISSSFNGSTTTFNLTVGGKAFFPGSAFSILVNLAGVVQEPESAYQINNATITFATAPVAGDQFFCIVLGVAHGINVPGNGTVDGAQLKKPFNYDGYFYLDDANNRVGVGTVTPQKPLHVVGEGQFDSVRVLGDLTVDGTTTTLDTVVTEVDRLEVGANNNTVGLAVTQSGSGDAAIFMGGDVGIGTNNPQGKLHISDTNHPLVIDDNSANVDQGIVFTSGGSSSYSAAIRLTPSGAANQKGLRFHTGGYVNSVERLRIHSSGKFSFGTVTASAAKYTFNSDGTNEVARFESTDAGAYLAIKDSSSTSINFVEGGGDVLSLGVNSVERLRITTSGVGIGTDDPQSQFEVFGSSPVVRSKSTTNQTYTQISNDGTDGYVDWSSGGLIFRGASNVERLRITSNGSTVIGGTTPATVVQTQLTLRSNGQVGLSLLCGAIQNSTIYMGGLADGYSSGDSGYSDGAISYNNSSNHMQFNTAGTERLRIKSDGQIDAIYGVINLGTADVSSGHINAYEVMTFNIDSDNDDTNRHFTWYKNGGSASGTAMMRLTEDGNLGINETNPAVSLDLSNNTDAVALPTGTTAQRPSGTDAYIRKNSTNNALEFYNGTNWVEIITDYFPTGSTTLG